MIFWLFKFFVMMSWSNRSFKMSFILMILNWIKNLLNSCNKIFMWLFMSMFWFLILRKFIKITRITSYIIQNLYDWSSCRSEISTACDIKICIKQIFDDQCLIWFLSEKLFVEHTFENHCCLYFFVCISSVSKKHKRFINDWMLSFKWTKTIAKCLNCESWSFLLFEKFEIQKLRNFRILQMCLK